MRVRGQTACNSTPCHHCVICLAGLPGDGPNVCAREMTDLATNAPPLAHHGQTTALAPTEAGRDQAWASEPTQLLSDGAVSACTGSRTRSRASDTRSDPEPTTDHGTFTLTGTGIPWVHSRRHTPSAPMISITSRPLTCSRAQTPAYTGPHCRAANASAAGHGTRHGDNRHRGGTRSDSSHDMTDVSRPWNRGRHRQNDNTIRRTATARTTS